MPEPNPPGRLPFGERKAAAPRPANPAAPRPVKPAAPKAPPAPPQSPMWELVEEDEIIDEVEVLDDEPKPKAAARVKAAPAGTKESRTTQARKPLRAESDGDGDGDKERRPKAKKKKRTSAVAPAVDEDQEARDRALREFEFIWPGILLCAGFVMCLVGAFGASDGVSAFVTIGVMVVGLFVTIPMTIIVLMVVGMLIGIEYGRLAPAILKIAAISFVTNGIYFIGAWAHLPYFFIFPIGCAVGFGLFMAQFDLDTWETNASVGALNVMTFVANIIMIGFLVVASASAGGGGYDEGDDDSDFAPPGKFEKDRKGPPPDFQEDDIGDDSEDEP